MIAFDVSVHDQASPALAQSRSRLSPEAIHKNLGVGLVKLTQNHLLRQPPNKQGWRSTHFWAAAAKATHYTADPAGLTITISKLGIAQRYYGGVIKPVNRKRLAIPATPEAAGKTPRDFSNLTPIAFKDASGVFRMALVEAPASQIEFGRAKDGVRPIKKITQVGGKIFFWLVKQATQTGNTAILPKPEDYAAEASRILRLLTN